MNYLYEELKAPTRLYIKQCPHCGLKYFGKSIKEDIRSYAGSGKHWIRHLKKHKVSPIHLWNSNWYYNTSITKFALRFSRMNKIVSSLEWANLIEENGLDGNIPTKEMNISSGNKISKIRNDPKWKETTGKLAVEKRKQTVNNNEWKDTVGKNQIKKLLKTISSDEWQKTVGKDWKNKLIETRNSDGYKEKHYKDCEYCGKCRIDPGNYSRHHGKNCKNYVCQNT